MTDDNRGTLRRNDKQETDKQPSHKGSCMVDGAEYWISAWVREKDGEKFFSMAFTKKESRGQ